MTSFVFTGDPRMGGKDQTPSCEMYGILFPAGEAVEVADEAKAEKLRRHSHFAEATGKAPKADEPERDEYDDMLIADLRAVADAKGVDHDGLTKAELREALRAA